MVGGGRGGLQGKKSGMAGLGKIALCDKEGCDISIKIDIYNFRALFISGSGLEAPASARSRPGGSPPSQGPPRRRAGPLGLLAARGRGRELLGWRRKRLRGRRGGRGAARAAGVSAAGALGRNGRVRSTKGVCFVCGVFRL